MRPPLVRGPEQRTAQVLIISDPALTDDICCVRREVLRYLHLRSPVRGRAEFRGRGHGHCPGEGGGGLVEGRV